MNFTHFINFTNFTMNKLVLLFFAFLLCKTSFAQEKTIALPYNSQLSDKAEILKKNQSKSFKGDLELPFFDDFSDSYLIPNLNRWDDKQVYINTTYGDNPPTLGVATFDALNFDGTYYSTASYATPYIADKLTSKPINLNYPADNSIYLSFYYQPQGFGDNPEPNDSLILEFFAPTAQTWHRVWFALGATGKTFEQVIIPVNDAKYLQAGFRFRFKNYFTLSSSSIASLVSNADQWNIDYVYLNKNRTANDLVYHDIAFLYPMQSIIKDYESIPWKHFKNDAGSRIKPNIAIKYKNNDNTIRLIDTLKFLFYDMKGKTPFLRLDAGSYNVLPNQLVSYNKPFSYPFTSNSVDSAAFKIKGVIVTSGFDSICNNTASYNQLFYNYYAYDDGNAEQGYGLYGEGTQNGMIAYKFYTYQPDTLKAVQMYFNRSLKETNKKYFYLTVWSSNKTTGKPDKILYKKSDYTPEFQTELNKFKNYDLHDTVLIVADTFYVGITQTSADFLNIGFDVSRNSQTKLFFNTNGQWRNTSITGALMIRPVFGKMATKITSFENITDEPVSIYPNPANDYLIIDYGSISNFSISIYDIYGKQVYAETSYVNKQPLELTNLSNGIYFVKLGKANKFITRKIIIMH